MHNAQCYPRFSLFDEKHEEEKAENETENINLEK